MWDGHWSANPTQGVNSDYIFRGCPGAANDADMLACSRVTPEPGIVDFGVIQKTATGFSPTKPLAWPWRRNAAAQSISARPSSPPVSRASTTGDSQSAIQVRDARNNLVPINEPFPLANFPADVSHIDVPFSASVVSLGDPKVGPFEAIMVVQVVYY